MQATVNEQDRIIAKVRALLNKTPERGATKEEAEAAAEAAQRLMQRYNLELAAIQEETGQGAEYVQETSQLGRRMWRRVLIHAVAKANFSKAIVYGANIRIIGQRHNIEATREVYAYLERAVKRLADEGYLAYNAATPYYPLSPKEWKESFYRGAVEEIRLRLEAQSRAFAAEAEECRALVVVNEQELAEAVNLFCGKVSKLNTSGRIHNDPFSAGRQAGRTVSLSPVREISGK